MSSVDLHIPAGINFECTGCGNCCLTWPVPLTGDDYERIAQLEVEAGVVQPGSSMRPLQSSQPKLKSFTHTLEKRADGRCAYLTEENQCRLHAQFGAQAKPSMCQLFPYTFTSTPSGVFASVSFASSGALFNSGRPLSDQGELLLSKWEQFRQLLPNLNLDWSTMQLSDGISLSWDKYLEIEGQLLEALSLDSVGAILSDLPVRLKNGSAAILQHLPKNSELDRNFADVSVKIVDQILIKTLLDFYFPADVFAHSGYDLPARQLAANLVTAPVKVTMGDLSFQDLVEFRLGGLGAEGESLLKRFLYCRIFAKLYFGAGFQNLSLIAGFHHLALSMLLLRIKLKCLLIQRKERAIAFLELAELLRILERRLTDAQFSKESVAILEVLLRSPARLERILFLAA